MGWFLLTVLLPVVAPVAGLLVFRLLPMPAAVKAAITPVASLKDSQLCWVSMGFCVAALYEIAEPSTCVHPLPRDLGNWSEAGFIALLVISVLFASGGSVFSTRTKVAADTHWAVHFSGMLTSLVVTLLAGFGYTLLHLKTN